MSLICRSTSAFTATFIFVGRPELGLLSTLFISLCFCRNLCIPIWLAIKPFSCNMQQIACSPFVVLRSQTAFTWLCEPICAKWRIRCLLYLLYTLAACERQKQQILPKATLLYSAPNHTCRLHDHLVSTQSFLLRSARRQLNKQTKRIVCLNNSTYTYK